MRMDELAGMVRVARAPGMAQSLKSHTQRGEAPACASRGEGAGDQGQADNVTMVRYKFPIRHVGVEVMWNYTPCSGVSSFFFIILSSKVFPSQTGQREEAATDPSEHTPGGSQRAKRVEGTMEEEHHALLAEKTKVVRTIDRKHPPSVPGYL